MEKYHTCNLLVAGESVSPMTCSRRICFSYDQNVRNISRLVISIVNDHRKKIGGNSHAKVVIKNITKI